MLCLSVAAVGATMGLSLLAALALVLRTALLTPTQAPARHGPIVVLGRRLAVDGTPCEVFRARLDRARALASRSDAPMVVLGGMTRPGCLSEAACGAQYLAAHGIDPARILVEARSRHTLENLFGLAATLATLPPGPPPVLVTSRTHLQRSLRMARSMGLTLAPCAAEARFRPSVASVREALLLHWYLTGHCVTVWSGSRRLAARLGLS